MLAAKTFLKDVSMGVGNQQGHHLDSLTHSDTIAYMESQTVNDKLDCMLCPKSSEHSWRHLDNCMWTCLHPDWHINYPASSAGDQTPGSKQWIHSNRTGAHWNLPWCLIDRVIMPSASLTGAVWRGQTWYPVLLGMFWDFPRLIAPAPKSLLMMPSPKRCLEPIDTPWEDSIRCRRMTWPELLSSTQWWDPSAPNLANQWTASLQCYM